MTSYDSIRLETDEAVAIVTLDRPQKLNAMDVPLLHELRRVVTEINEDPAIRVAILTGAGRSFCAGADLTAPLGPGQSVGDHLREDHRPVLMAIVEAPKPWISAVNGAAAGVGSAYAMTCDLTVMAEDAYIYQAFAAIGLVPDGGATWHLARTIGRKRAYELIVTGEKALRRAVSRAGPVQSGRPLGAASRGDPRMGQGARGARSALPTLLEGSPAHRRRGRSPHDLREGDPAPGALRGERRHGRGRQCAVREADPTLQGTLIGTSWSPSATRRNRRDRGYNAYDDELESRSRGNRSAPRGRSGARGDRRRSRGSTSSDG